jgi:AcrR family transcriptional regulator
MADHMQRRRDVCEIAAKIIAREGVEGITFRNVAREANCSTRIVSHYFKNKRDLLLMTFREFSNTSLEEGEAAINSGVDLQLALEQLLPLDRQRRLNWQVWLAFWGTIAGDPEFIAEQILRGRQIVALIERMLVRALGTTAPPDMDWTFESERIVTLIVGIATQSLFDPRKWTAAKQRGHLAKELGDIRYNSGVMGVTLSARNADSDYVGTCKDGTRYHVFVNGEGRVVVQML